MHQSLVLVKKQFSFLFDLLVSAELYQIPKFKVIVDWSVLKKQKNLCQWLGLANYLHNHRTNYAVMDRPSSNFLKKDVN